TGLTPGTLYYVRAYATNAVGTVYGGEVTFTTLAVPTVTSQAVTSIGSTTATGNGTVTADGGSSITERGIVWNTGGSPTIVDGKATAAGSTGVYSAPIAGLTMGTLYHVRAYAINAVGTTYGGEVTCTTLTVPTVTTQEVASIGDTTATGNGTVVSDGGSVITERGIVWNTSGTPTTASSKAIAAGTTGVYNASITGLTAGTVYHVRAYAINAIGTSYGNDVTFNIGWMRFTPGEGAVTLDPTTSGGTITVNTGITFSSAGCRVDDWGAVTKVGEDYQVDAVVSCWTGPSAQMVNRVTHAYSFDGVAPGSHNFKFYANGTLVKTIPFVVAASIPTSRSVAVTSLLVPGTPYTGKTVLVQVVVQNRGKTMDTFTVELFAGGKVVGKVAVKDLAPGKSRKLYLRWTPATVGEVTLAAAVTRDRVSLDSSTGTLFEQKVVVRRSTVIVPSGRAPGKLLMVGCDGTRELDRRWDINPTLSLGANLRP
ncbi:MAG: CARDB domain-containing protein, partial [Dehalococcoidia bacterium]|nr:CARDB domain-containing protein [Dehalococcoidia bacterium]